MPEFLHRIWIRLFFIVILAVLPSIVLTVINSSEARRQAVDKVKVDLQNLNVILTEREKHIFEDERRFLASLSSMPEIRSGNTLECNQHLESLLEANPNHLNLGVTDKDGSIFCSALPIAGPINVADRPYFQHAIEYKDFSIGGYQIGRITGKASINFGFPVLDDIGTVNRVIFEALDLGYLNRLFQEATLPEGATVTLLDRNGTILVRFPEADGLVGEQIQLEPIFSAILHQKGGGSLEGPDLDGVSKLFAFDELQVSQQTTDTFLLIGVPVNIAYADADQLLWRNLVGIALASVLSLAAAWLFGYLTILRPVNFLIIATRRLASGKLDERVDVLDGHGELSELGHAFNEMASALEKRELEMQRVHEALQESEQRYRTVFEDVPVGLYRTTSDGEILDANSALLEMFGYPDLETIRTANVKNIYVNLADRERLAALLERQGIVRDYEAQFRRYDGTVIWVRDTVRAVRDVQGQLKFFEGSLQDVTDHKLALEELRRLAIRSQALVRISSRLNAQLDLDTVARVVCEETARALDISTVGISWYDSLQGSLFHGAVFTPTPESEKWIQPRLVTPGLHAELTQEDNHFIILDQWPNDGGPVGNSSQHLKFHKIILARLARQSELIGTINLYLHENNQMIDEDGLSFLRSLADQATQAVINARLLEDARQRLERLASLHRIDLAIVA
jgi:PAS domain S-box-containing protein